MNLSQRSNQARYHKGRQWGYTFFLVQLPSSINKAIRIHVFYHPWNQNFIIYVMNMHHNISSGVSKNVFFKSIIDFGYPSAVIFLWGVTKKERKKKQIPYWGMLYIHAIWYILESVYLSNFLFVIRHVTPDWSLYYSLR